MDFIESSDEETQNESDDESQADYNYVMAGTEVPVPPD
jgi:hypothetical protein